jgi:hypothetical protein
MDQFVRLSSALCGIDSQKLAPAIDPINIKQTYFDRAGKEAPVAFAQILQIAADNPTLPPQALADLILTGSGKDIQFLARSIMLAWYLGSWYQPADLEKSAKDPTARIDFRVISMNAYTKGWAWSVAQAHPMGFSTMTFGYWGEAPPSLADYIEAEAAS